MLPSTHTKRDAIFATLFLTILSVTTFLCGFAVDHFLIQQQEQNQVHQMRRRGLRTSTHSTKDHKRNFEYCDQTWNDMDYNYPQFHEDAARKINTTDMDINHRYAILKNLLPQLTYASIPNHPSFRLPLYLHSTTPYKGRLI